MTVSAASPSIEPSKRESANQQTNLTACDTSQLADFAAKPAAAAAGEGEGAAEAEAAPAEPAVEAPAEAAT